MRHFGPEADKGRDLLRRDLDWALDQFWGDDRSAPQPTTPPTR